MLNFDLASDRILVTEGRKLTVSLHGARPDWLPELHLRGPAGLSPKSETKEKWWSCAEEPNSDPCRFELQLEKVYRLRTYPSTARQGNALKGSFTLTRSVETQTYFFKASFETLEEVRVEVFGLPQRSVRQSPITWAFRKFKEVWVFDSEGDLIRLGRFDRLGIFEL